MGGLFRNDKKIDDGRNVNAVVGRNSKMHGRIRAVSNEISTVQLVGDARARPRHGRAERILWNFTIKIQTATIVLGENHKPREKPQPLAIISESNNKVLAWYPTPNLQQPDITGKYYV
uniref:Uncharacterized protein n=1 Tax=Vespula pensylvanica TaxID=30213 RepID=A0A834UBZ3_VESPE|nr:hypothetical protein H0235_005756 [Vespula pensylvanica]